MALATLSLILEGLTTTTLSVKVSPSLRRRPVHGIDSNMYKVRKFVSNGRTYYSR